MIWGRKQKVLVNPAEDSTSIGQVLLDMKLVTKEALDEAVARKINGHPLGLILVEMGAISTRQLDEALLKQKVLRGSAKPAEVAQFMLDTERQAADGMKTSLDNMITMSSHLVAGLRTKPR